MSWSRTEGRGEGEGKFGRGEGLIRHKEELDVMAGECSVLYHRQAKRPSKQASNGYTFAVKDDNAGYRLDTILILSSCACIVPLTFTHDDINQDNFANAIHNLIPTNCAIIS